MAGIWNVNSSYNNMDIKKLISKLSFEVGEVFLAKVVSLGKGNQDVLLKMLDGWQFPAKLNTSLDFQPTGAMKFKVSGYENGKILLEILNNNQSDKELNEDSIDYTLKKQNIDIDKKDYNLLREMVKHDMPLTKDNISHVKTIVDFMDKISKDESYEDNFIDKYIKSKGINSNENEAKNIKHRLKSFFKELKGINKEELLTMLENNIDLDADNIKNFNKLIKKPKNIFNELNELKQVINSKENQDVMRNDIKGYKNDFSEDKVKLQNDNVKDINGKQNSEDLQNILKDNKSGKVNLKDTGKINENIENSKTKEDGKVNVNKDINISEKVKEGLEVKDLKKQMISSKSQGLENLSDMIKEQLEAKTEDMKNTIRTFLQNKDNFKPEMIDKVMQMMQKDMGEFKVFNTISNQYYYMELPIDVKSSEYDCKLIIKDDRRQGKKIDSKNVKIATSINTENMGIVDGYISVNNMNMHINIKCSRQWLKLLEYGKDNILNSLDNTGYNIAVTVEEKKEDATLISCREFFQDNDFNTLNVKA